MLALPNPTQNGYIALLIIYMTKQYTPIFLYCLGFLRRLSKMLLDMGLENDFLKFRR